MPIPINTKKVKKKCKILDSGVKTGKSSVANLGGFRKNSLGNNNNNNNNNNNQGKGDMQHNAFNKKSYLNQNDYYSEPGNINQNQNQIQNQGQSIGQVQGQSNNQQKQVKYTAQIMKNDYNSIKFNYK
jgi:hypothetical protein